MGPKGNLIMSAVVIGLSLMILIVCSSTAVQEYILDLVKGN